MHQIWLAVRSGVAIGLLAVLPLGTAALVVYLLRGRIAPHRRPAVRRALRGVAVVTALVLIGAVTLAPSGYALHSLNAVPFRDVVAGGGTRGLVNCAGNAALFVPLGVALALFGGRLPLGKAILVTVTVSLVVETVQYATPVGRVADVTDVAMNVMGAALGYVAAQRRPGYSPL